MVTARAAGAVRRTMFMVVVVVVVVVMLVMVGVVVGRFVMGLVRVVVMSSGSFVVAGVRAGLSVGVVSLRVRGSHFGLSVAAYVVKERETEQQTDV
jgi:hypothetical protein